MPNWTKEQLEAIKKDNQNIIVSAGAGSGKTAVLTNRVLRKIIDGIDIDKLLILTFTNAAAKEMKDRIRKELQKDLSLKKQLDLIEGSFITTFDSFALSLVKKYHYLLNISKDVSIADSNIIKLEKNKIIDKIFNNMYENKNSKFLKLIDDLCIKDDESIRKYILDIDQKLDLKINKQEFLDTYEKEYFNLEFINKQINKYLDLINEQKELLKNNLEELKYLVDGEYYYNHYDLLKKLLDSTEYNDIKNSLDFKLPNKPKNCDEEVTIIKEEISNIIKKIKELCHYDSVDEIKKEILLTYDYVTIIIEIIKTLDNKIQEYKFKNELFEFNDIVKMSINVIQNNKSVKEEIKNNFKEIMIDEYQDTNDIQEYFISLISDNNVYMVGDIKQSIYRFRNANPNIFKNKYEKYSQNSGGYKIDLNKNFRSRDEVLNNINLIFNYLMDNDLGGANYKESHQMLFGNTSYEDNKPNQNYNNDIYTYEYAKDSIYTKEEIESFIVAEDIINKVKNKYQIFDKEEKIYRDCKYSDFSILIDRSTSFTLIKKIFNYKHIPLSIYSDENINSSYCLRIIHNIIKLLIKEKNKEYDTEYKYLFMSLARSFICSYDDMKIFKYLKNNNISDSESIQKIKKIIIDLDEKNISQILYSIYNEFSIYEKLVEIGNIDDNLVIMEYLYDVANEHSKLGKTIYDFSEYIEDIIDNGYENKLSVSKDESNSVKVMTIHKSKGLEFPVCYYIGLYKEFNFSDIKDRFIYSNNYGIIAPYYKNGIGKTIYIDLLKNDYIMDEISEKIRLFYVAITRAKEKMIFILPENLKKSNKKYNINMRKQFRSFADIIYALNDYLNSYKSNIDLENLKLTKKYNTILKKEIELDSDVSKLQIETFNINDDINEEQKFSKTINSIINSGLQKNLDLGLQFHETLEYIDFKNPNYDIIDNILIKNKIKNFISKLDLNYKNIYKETEFMYTDNNINYHGIIDLVIEYDTYVNLIDYKLKYTESEDYKKQLIGYKKYLEKITSKPVYVNLYSILNEEFLKINL